MNNLEQYEWSEWRPFPHPHKKGILVSPFGFGVYQLRNVKTDEFILFGRGDNLSHRMSTLLPIPFGISGRKNVKKKNYVLENIKNIEYRTIPCSSHEESVRIEKDIKNLNIHKFNK
jgi:hypothetical protein